MANRHLSRSIALQCLFEWDMRGGSFHVGDTVESSVSRSVAEFAPGMGDIAFVVNLIDGVLAQKENIDEIIVKAAPEWPLQKISAVDRNVLRIGLYELLFSDRKEVPAKVAINEAIELAKTYGGDNSGKFVNGVLGAIYKELGEPGKDEVSTKKKKIADIPFEEMPIQNLGGAIVFARHEDNIYMALVHDVFGHWTLSKGKIPKDVDVKEGTIAKIKEEIGIKIKIKEDLGMNEYVASDPELGKIRKQVHYFLAESKYETLKLADKGGLDDAQWFKISDILELNFYNDILPMVTKAITLLSEGKV
ncbi:MAG: transcription antitermination factor NusB [bacterium]|nr:transcription antitermination factor NusB [bacterium]